MSQFLNKLMESSTTTVDTSLNMLKSQQKIMEKKLYEQELVNKELYKQIFESGILQNRAASTPESPVKAAISSSVKSILDLERTNEHVNYLAKGDLISAMLPFNDMIKGMSQVFEKFFDSKFWIYSLCGVIAGASLTCFTYLFIRFMCCSCIGQSIIGCFRTKKIKKADIVYVKKSAQGTV